MKNEYTIQIIDLRFQIDHINPKKVQLLEDYRGATNNSTLYKIIIRHRENRIISVGRKIFEVIIF